MIPVLGREAAQVDSPRPELEPLDAITLRTDPSNVASAHPRSALLPLIVPPIVEPMRLLVIPLIWSLIGFWAAISLGIREDIGLLLAGLLPYVHERVHDAFATRPSQVAVVDEVRAARLEQELHAELVVGDAQRDDAAEGLLGQLAHEDALGKVSGWGWGLGWGRRW